MTGKEIRLARISDYGTGRMLLVPMDHGVYRGPVQGIYDPHKIMKQLIAGGADAVIVHEGLAKRVAHDIRGRIGLIVKITNTTALSPEGTFQTLISSVEGAMKVGADAVSVEVQCRAEKENEMLKILGDTAEMCDSWSIPLLAMMYFVADDKVNAFDPKTLGHVARVGAELGADIVKTRYTGSPDTFKQVVGGCPVPIVIAGGPKTESPRQLLEMVKGAIDAGGAGVAMGRNIFQFEDPTKMARAIRKIIHENATVDEALVELK